MKGLAERVLLVCALVWLPATAQAQPFPTGPISLVVPLAPGDAADIDARATGEISRLLKTPVILINRPGAGGAVGTNSVVGPEEDATRFCLRRTARSPFVPFSTRGRSPTMRSGIWCHSARLTHAKHARRAQRHSLSEFRGADRIREEQAGEVRIGHPGSGSVGDFCVQLINALTGAELVPVPYVGAAPAVVALRRNTSKVSCFRSVR